MIMLEKRPKDEMGGEFDDIGVESGAPVAASGMSEEPTPEPEPMPDDKIEF